MKMNCHKNICVNLFQNHFGEICAEVRYNNGEKECNKLIENIDRFAKTPEQLFEYLLNGFADFADYNSIDYAGKDIGTTLMEMTEDDGYKLIVHFEFNGISVDYYFENMNTKAIDLIKPIKIITDKKAEEYDRGIG